MYIFLNVWPLWPALRDNPPSRRGHRSRLILKNGMTNDIFWLGPLVPCSGAALAAKRRGKVLDMLQYGAACGIIGGLLALIANIVILRMG